MNSCFSDKFFNCIRIKRPHRTFKTISTALCALAMSVSLSVSGPAASATVLASAQTQASTQAQTSAQSASQSASQSTSQDSSQEPSKPASQEAGAFVPDAALSWPAEPSVLAGSAILIDADTGAILYDKACHSKAFPASTTKIMTALLAIENNSLDEVITFSRAAANSYKWDESNTGTREGEQFTLEQALYAILLKSANEVAYGMAEHISGSVPAFAAMMNKRAAELGALNTHFNNANGLSDPNHYTTAYDLAMIGRACFNNSTFMTIDSTENYQIAPTNKTSETRYFSQRHGMLKGNNYQYEYCKGGKTGFTDESGYTLITFAQKDDMRLICVVLREADDKSRYVDTKALFDYGFNNFRKISVSGSDVSSVFNSTNYYSSRIYGSPGITFSMNSSYVNLPLDASFSDVSIEVSGNDADFAAYEFTADISFIYDGHFVGMTSLTVNTGSSSDAGNLLPYLKEDNSSVVSQKNCLVINMWYVIIGIVLILIIFEIYESIRESRMRRQRRRRVRRRR